MDLHDELSSRGNSSSPGPDFYELHRLASERSPVPVALTSGPEHSVCYVNQAWCDRLEDQPRTFLGHSLSQALRGAAELQTFLDGVAKSGTSESKELEAWSLLASPILDREGTTLGLIVHVLDAPRAESGQMAQDLQEANERLLLSGLHEAQRAAELKALLDALAEGVAVFDARGEVSYVNPRGRALLRLESGEPTLQDLQALELRRRNGAPVDFRRDILARQLQGESLVDEELQLTSAHAPTVHLLLSGSCVLGPRGEIALAIQVYRDITALRELEQSREQYVSLITHDLRGPLTAASVGAQRLSRENDSPHVHALAGGVLQSLKRMDTMVRDLLDAQRIRSGHGLPLKLAECDLAVIAREVVDELSSAKDSPGFVLRAEPPLKGIWSAAELRRALWNLASNARKYGAAHAPIVITVERKDETQVELSVHNEGTPIPLEDQERLFAPYERTPAATRSQVRGWGLGLTLVRGCAEAHGGSVRVESAEGRGTTFTLELPLDARNPLN
jgi:signal transduction histidine kinase